MEPPRRFRYRLVCSSLNCRDEAVYKVAAPWSDGPRRELKNYGLACEEHRDALLARARESRGRLTLMLGESLEEVRLFRLDPERRDTDLEEAASPAVDDA